MNTPQDSPPDPSRSLPNQLKSGLPTQAPLTRPQLQKQAEHTVLTQEEDFLRIARELHDGAGQSLTALKIKLEMTRSDLQQCTAESVAQDLETAIQLADAGIQSIRTVEQRLRPPSLDILGLESILEDCCEEWSRRSGILIVFDGNISSQPSRVFSLLLYRFAQESLAFISSRDDSNLISVTLHSIDDCFLLVISDNSQNADETTEDTSTTLPLQRIAERINLVGGWVSMRKNMVQGRRIAACIPRNQVT